MSDTVSTHTKTLTETNNSDSTESPLFNDRWTNNISYRQLVASSCIGVFQVCWNPYLHDLEKLVPFLFLYNVFSILVAYPLLYLELALGVSTKKGVLNCWHLAPQARGVGFGMLFCCVASALVAGAIGAWSLAMLVHSFHTFLPWLHCAATAYPACAARHRFLLAGSETPPQSFFFNYVLDLRRESLAGGLGSVVRELSVYYVITWLLVYLIAIKRIYSYSKLVLFKDLLTYFVLLCCAIGAMHLNGAKKMFSVCDWSVLFDGMQMWEEAVEYALLEIGVCHGSLVMLGSYCPKQQHQLSTTASLAFFASKITCMASTFILGAVHGALHTDYQNATNIFPGTSSAMILWSDYVARVPGSQFWSCLVFFTIFVLSLTTAGLLVQTLMSTFTGRSVRKVRWAFLILTCVLFCLIGILTLCTQGGLHIVNFLISWPVTKPRVLVAAILTSTVTYIYGQSTFCEDVFFAVGQYPSGYMRVCWAVAPVMLAILFVGGSGQWSGPEALAGWLLTALALLPASLFIIFYALFKCRVRNIVRSEN